MQALFEDLPRILDKGNKTRFVSLGATFSNYEPAEVLPLLRTLVGKQGFAFIDVQLRDRVDMAKVAAVYRDQLQGVIDPKLDLLGIKADDISHREADEGVRIWCTIERVTPELDSLGLKVGDKLLILRSLRYTKESFEGAIATVFPKHIILDRGKTFLGALLIE